LRKSILGELLAPAVNPIFWNLVMKRAVRNEEGTQGPACRRFRPQFLGIDGSWRFMRVLRWGKPAEVLADSPSCLTKLTAPTLIFHGSRDPAIPASFAVRAAGLIPNAELVHVDCGHFIPLNRPAFVAGRLMTFLAGAENSAARDSSFVLQASSSASKSPRRSRRFSHSVR